MTKIVGYRRKIAVKLKSADDHVGRPDVLNIGKPTLDALDVSISVNYVI